MKKIHAPHLGIFSRILTILVVMVTLLGVFSLVTGRHVGAAATSTVNFQARLMTGAGSVVPDGDYNVEFKLYNALSSSGSSQGSCTGDAACLWTETRTSANKVRVANGYLTVELGSVTTLPAINWSQNLYLSLNIGGTSSPAWDGEMTPRLHLTAVPYAFSAAQLSATNAGFTSTLSFVQPTASNSILVPDAAGTLCLQGSSACGFAPSSGSGNYIQNGTSLQSGANFNISGTGTAGTSLQAPLLDTATAVALNIGTTNATAINLNKNTVITGGLTQSGGIIDLSGNAASTIKTTSGGLTLQAFNTNTLTITTTGAGTIVIGGGSTSTINLGRGADVARTYNLGYLASGTTSQTINLGYTSTGSVTNIYGGTSSTAINVTPASGGAINLTTTGTGQIKLTTGSSGTIVKPTTDNTSAFQVQNAAGGYVFSVDTSNNTLGLATLLVTTPTLFDGTIDTYFTGALGLGSGTASAVNLGNTGSNVTIQGNASSTIKATSGSFTTTLSFTAPTANRSIVFPDAAGTVCLQSSTSCGFAPSSGSANYIQNSASAQSANMYVQAASSGSVAGVLRANAAGTGDILDLKNGAGTNVATFSSAGAVLLQNSTNSTTALQIQNAAGTSNLLIADTTNTRIAIAQATATYTLDVAGDINSTTQLRVSGTIVCDSTGCTAKSGSGFYVHNQTTVQSANMYIQSASNGVATAVIQANATSGNILNLISGGGTTVGTVSNSGSFQLQNASNSTSAFQVTAFSSNNAVLRVDTTNERVAIGVISDPIGAKLSVATGTTVTLRGFQSSTFDAFQLGNSTADFLTVGSTGNFLLRPTTNSANAFRIQDSSSNTLMYVDTVNSQLLFGSSLSTKHVFMDMSTNNGVLEVGATGGNLVVGLKQISNSNAQIYHTSDLVVQRTSGTSATDFQIQNASNTALFTVDTAGNNIQIGSATTDATATLLTLDSSNASSDPTGIAGAMYYSTTWKSMRCYQDGSWSNCSDPTRLTHGYNIQEEFIATSDGAYNFSCSASDIGTTYAWACDATGTGTDIATTVTDGYQRPGQLTFSTGTTASGEASVYFSGGSTPAFVIGGGETFETAINIPTLSNGTQQYTIRVGLCDENLHGADCGNGVYFEYASATSANWRYATAKGSTRTKNSSTKAVATGWTNLKFVATSSTSVTFYVKSAGETSYTSIGTISTNVPNAAANATALMLFIDKSIGLTSRSFIVDYVDYWNDFTSNR